MAAGSGWPLCRPLASLLMALISYPVACGVVENVSVPSTGKSSNSSSSSKTWGFCCWGCSDSGLFCVVVAFDMMKGVERMVGEMMFWGGVCVLVEERREEKKRRRAASARRMS